MSAHEVRVGDIGTVIRFTIQDGSDAVDVSTASTQQILLRKPDGTVLTKTSSFTTDGTDGQVEYATVSGDLDTQGLWRVQAKLVIATGTWSTDIHELPVHPNLA